MKRGIFQPATPVLVSLAWQRERRLLLMLLAAMGTGFAAAPLFMVFVGQAIGSIPAGAKQVLLWGSIAGTVFVAMQIASQLRQTLGEILGQRLGIHLRDRALGACEITGTGHLDDPRSRDDLAVVAGAARGLPLDRATMGLAEVTTSTLTTVGAIIVLAFFHVWVALGIGLIWAGARLLLTAENHKRMELLFGQATQLRRTEYLRRLAVQPTAAKEIRVFGLGGWLLDRLHQAWSDAVLPTWAQRRHSNRRVILLSLALIPLYGGVLVLLARQTAAGTVSLAGFAIFFQALVATTNVFGGSAAYGLDVALAPVAAVRRLEERQAAHASASEGANEPFAALADGIEAREVAFRYGDAKQALSGVSLRVGAGETIALVGANGAGKTTLLKLLAGFHEPTSGSITVDGTDLAHLSKTQWRTQLAMVFQDFARLPLSIADNVTLLRYNASDAEVLECLELAGLADVVASLPDGIHTALADGMSLSGGQWQRLALARAFLAMRRGANVLILDEPTANVDVAGELELFSRLLDAAAGRTVIVVSHRFSTVRMMRRIIVLDEGRVIEEGSHDELMALDGRYRSMFLAQARPFQVEVNQP